MPSYPLPARPGTQGSVRDRNPGLAFLSGSSLETKSGRRGISSAGGIGLSGGGASSSGGRRGVSTASGGTRPPLPGSLGASGTSGTHFGGPSSRTDAPPYNSVSGGGGGTGTIPPLFNAPQKRLNTAPIGAGRPAPPGSRSGKRGSEVGSSGGGVGIPSVNSFTHRKGSGGMRRPPSSGSVGARATVPLSGNFTNSGGDGPGSKASSNGKNDFHKGLVSALHEVLKKQRHGVFPQPVSNNEVEAMRQEAQQQQQQQQQYDSHPVAGNTSHLGSNSRPGTGSSQVRPPSGRFGSSGSRDEDVEALIRQRKMQWAQNRWKNVREQERRDQERKEAFVNHGGLGGIARGYRVDTPTRTMYEEGDDIFLDDDTIALLHNLERMERNARQTIVVAEVKKHKEMERIIDQQATRILTATGSPAVNSSSDSLGGDSSIGGAAGGSTPDGLKAEGNRLYETGNYAAAHKCYSQAIDATSAFNSNSSHHNSSQAILNTSGTTCTNQQFLLTNRAACNMALLNYDAVIKDCQKALELDPHMVKAYGRMAKAYALLGQHKQASKHYASAVHYGSLQQGNSNSGVSSSFVERVGAEARAVDTLEKVKQLQAADNHEQVVESLDGSYPFVGDPPVALLRLRSLIIVDPAQARSDANKLIQSLEHPACNASGEMLLFNSVTFYADVLVAAGKASFYCGQHYLKIARQFITQCLQLRKDHKPAIVLEKTLGLFEQRFQLAAQQHHQNKFSDAHATYTLALAVDSENKKLMSTVFMCRAEVSQRLANVPAVISDCTSALDCDGSNFKALSKRAKCFGDIGDYSRAVRDLERAVKLNPALEDELQEMRAKQSEDQSGAEFFGKRPGSGANFGGSTHGGGGGGGAGPRSRPQSGAAGGNWTHVFVEGRCHYTILGLPRFVDVNSVRQQYRKLTLRYHPDKCVNETVEEKKKSELRFKEISTSYTALADNETKRVYDGHLRAAVAAS